MEMGNTTKNKLFIWLATEGKILTWDTRQQKGWEGPNHCLFCKSENESISHLFISCIFTKSIWERLNTILNFKGVWTGSLLSDCFKSWIKEKSNITYILTLIYWYTWLERNFATFKNNAPSFLSMITKTLFPLRRNLFSQKPIQDRACLISQHAGNTLACFDGDAWDYGKQYGAGV
jgi:hypothetical protein